MPDASNVGDVTPLSRPSRTITLEAAATGLLTCAISLIAFGPVLRWLGTPWASGDMLSTYVDASNWQWVHYAVGTHYGFPYGMNLAYFPDVNITQNLFAQVVNTLSGNPFLGINVLLVLSFPIVAVLAYFALRLVGLHGPLAIALATAYSLIPYHWGRGLGHFYLATMYAGVTGVMLALLIGTGHLTRRYHDASRSGRRWLLVGVVALVVVTAVSGIYYAAFALILGVAALVWRLAQSDRWRAIGLQALPYAAILGCVALGILPSIITLHNAPPTSSLGTRMPIESVLLAGNLAMALLPLPMSTLPLMDHYNVRIADAINAAPLPHLEGLAATNYGTWVTTACLVVMLVGLVWSSRRKVRFGPLTYVTYLTIVTVLFFIPWGVNYLFAGTVTAQIRGWNRLLPILLLLLVLGAGSVLARVRWAHRAVIVWPVVLIALVLTITDVVKPFATIYRDTITAQAAGMDQARAYSRAVNAAIPGNCGILQLPYMAFPENGPIVGQALGIGDYDPFLQPLTNQDKSWSYGAVKYTAASSWLASLSQFPMDNALADLRTHGFCAIHIDTNGYSATQVQHMQTYYDVMLGKPVATGSSGRWMLYRLR